jgi:hypothetical protein
MKARAIIEAELSPRQFLKQVGKQPPVAPKDMELLRAEGFGAPGPVDAEDDEADIYWVKSMAWGGGIRRTESVALDVAVHAWSACISHVRKGRYGRHSYSPYYDEIADLLDWIKRDREDAPRLTREAKEGSARQMIKRLARPYTDERLREEFVYYLEHVLIPDLHESGRDATAEEFEHGVNVLKQEPTQAGFQDMDLRLWVRWLQDTWIPDLYRSALDETAHDAETMIRFIAGRGYWVHPGSLSHDAHPNRIKDEDEDE